MKIGYLGAGSWGFCLATLLAGKGHTVTSWTRQAELAKKLSETKIHPLFPDIKTEGSISFTTCLEEALEEKDMIVESVTTRGLRPVLLSVKEIKQKPCPFIITSKGIEIETGLTLPDAACDVLGGGWKPYIGMISGPSFAEEIISGLPGSIVGTAFDREVMHLICDVFTTDKLRVYPNTDIAGIALAGAMKNIVAICCGMAHGLKMGNSAIAALMTRGLHEIKKLAVARGCRPETFSGLAGMGDLCMTCSCPMSRNFRFGQLVAGGKSPDQAKREIGMVVEGYYSCEAALRLSKEMNIPMPITEGLYKILHGQLNFSDAIPYLMQRTVKEEHL